MAFEIRGEAVTLPSGMNRAPEEGKTDYLLPRDGPMFKRWAEHLTRAVPVRGRRNWMNAQGDEDLERFKRAAARHFEQWLDGETDEDHVAAVFFNMNGAEYVRDRLET